MQCSKYSRVSNFLDQVSFRCICCTSWKVSVRPSYWLRNCLDLDVSSDVSRGKKSFLFSLPGRALFVERKKNRRQAYGRFRIERSSGKQMSFTLDLSVVTPCRCWQQGRKRETGETRDGIFRRRSISCQESSLMDWEKYDESRLTAVDACKEISKERWQLILDKTRSS